MTTESSEPFESADLVNLHSVLGTKSCDVNHPLWPATRKAIADAGYELSGTLGETSRAIVFHGKHTGDEGDVAIKVLLDPEDRKYFERERKILANLKKLPEVVGYRGSLEPNDILPCIVLESIDGDQIHEYVRKTKMKMRDRIELLEKLFRALQGLHDSGIMHRDISPRNVLVERDNTVRFIDFGLGGRLDPGYPSKHTVTRSRLGTEEEKNEGIGTDGYADAKQLSGDVRGDRLTEIHAAAAVAFKVLTGKTRTDSTDDQCRLKDRRELKAARVPRQIRRIILACLHDPGIYREAFQVAEELRRWSERGERRIHRIKCSMGALLVVAFVAIAAVLYWQHEETNKQAELERAQERLEDVGETLNATPWVEKARQIAETRTDVEKAYLAIRRQLEDGQTATASRAINELRRKLSQLAEKNKEATRADAAQNQYELLARSVSDRLQAEDGYDTIDSFAENGRQAFNDGDFALASDFFGQTVQQLDQWLKKNETADELVARQQATLQIQEREKLLLEQQVRQLKTSLGAQVLGGPDSPKQAVESSKQLPIIKASEKRYEGSPRDGGKSPYQEATEWINKGYAFSQAGDYQEALECYKKAEKLAPTWVLPRYNQAFILWRLGLMEPALNKCTEAVQMDDQHAKSYYLRARIAHGRGNLKQAVSDFRKAIQLAPADRELAMANWYLWKILWEQAKDEEAWDYFTKWVSHQRKADRLDGLEQLGDLHFGLAMPKREPIVGWLGLTNAFGQSLAQYRERADDLPVKMGPQPRVIYLQPLAQFNSKEHEIIGRLKDFLEICFNCTVKVQEAMPVSRTGGEGSRKHPKYGYQLSTAYLRERVLQPGLPSDALARIGITDADLWPGEGYNYCFGSARSSQGVAVLSINRLDPREQSRCLKRTLKLGMSLTGQVMGLSTCILYQCAMNSSNHIGDLNEQPLWLCPHCLAKVRYATGSDPVQRFARLHDFCRRHNLRDEQGHYEKSLRRLLGPLGTAETPK